MVAKNPLGLRLTKESSVLNLTAPSLEAAIEMENRAQSILSVAPEFVATIETFSTRSKNRP